MRVEGFHELELALVAPVFLMLAGVHEGEMDVPDLEQEFLLAQGGIGRLDAASARHGTDPDVRNATGTPSILRIGGSGLGAATAGFSGVP